MIGLHRTRRITSYMRRYDLFCVGHVYLVLQVMYQTPAQFLLYCEIRRLRPMNWTRLNATKGNTSICLSRHFRESHATVVRHTLRSTDKFGRRITYLCEQTQNRT